MGARWYDARLGRWTSPDTIIPDLANPQSLNRYSYVLGNPLRYTDPSGHFWDDIVEWYTETIRKFYVSNSVPGLPQDFVNNYVERGGDVHLSPDEMMETNPVVDIWRSDDFKTEVHDLESQGGGTEYIEVSGPAGAFTNGTLGHFTANFKGDVTVGAQGEWSFDGTVDFYDVYDFDPRSWGERPVLAELKVRITDAVLPGDPFTITSNAIPVTQSNLDDLLIYLDYLNYFPQAVIDPLSQKLDEVE